MKKSRHEIENCKPISIFNMTEGHSQVVWPKIDHEFLYQNQKSLVVKTTVKNSREFTGAVFVKSRLTFFLTFIYCMPVSM